MTHILFADFIFQDNIPYFPFPYPLQDRISLGTYFHTQARRRFHGI